MEAAASMTRRISPFLLAILMIAFVLSLASIYAGFEAYIRNNSSEGSLYLTMGMTTLIISTYLWLQTRKHMLRFGMGMEPLNTTVECLKCGFKNVRDFQRGDYIFKHTEDQCPKCNEKTMTIGSIFREVKEKEKAREAGYS